MVLRKSLEKMIAPHRKLYDSFVPERIVPLHVVQGNPPRESRLVHDTGDSGYLSVRRLYYCGSLFVDGLVGVGCHQSRKL